jgi:hypothetical protein
VDVVQTTVNVKTVHEADKTIIPTANQADGLEMTDLDPEAGAHQDEMTDLDPGTQDEMTDLDQVEMTDLYRRTLPILNTSRGKCIAPWSKYVLEVRRLSRLLDVVRLPVEHLPKLHGHHRVQR